MTNNLMLNNVLTLGSAFTQSELRLTAKALSIHSWLNDSQDRLRLTAARHALAHWPEYVAACRAKRDARTLTHAMA